MDCTAIAYGTDRYAGRTFVCDLPAGHSGKHADNRDKAETVVWSAPAEPLRGRVSFALSVMLLSGADGR